MKIYQFINKIKENFHEPIFLGNDKNLFNIINWDILNNILEENNNLNINLLKNFNLIENTDKESNNLYIKNNCSEKSCLYIKNINFFDYEINKFCIYFLKSFNLKVYIDLEIGTIYSKAFHLNKQKVSTLIFQRYGSSLWNIYKDDPREKIYINKSINTTEFVLKEGDFIYVPNNHFIRKKILSDNYMILYINLNFINYFLFFSLITNLIEFDKNLSLPIDLNSNKSLLFLSELKEVIKEIFESREFYNNFIKKYTYKDYFEIDIKKIWNI